MKKFILPLLLSLFIAACGPQIYKTQDFATATAKHKIVAILPAEVNIKLRPNEAKRMSPEQLRNNEESTGYAIQDKLYSWFLQRSTKKEFTVKFQDVNKTNSLLKNAGIEYRSLSFKSKDEIAKLLGVDAIISTNIRMDKPMSEGAALAVGIVFGAWGTTNAALTTIDIHDAKDGSLLWKYDYEASGSVGSSPDKLVNALMRNASKKFPYNNK